MSELKKYLKENRNIFDDQTPPDGHFERFESRLDRLAEKKKSRQTSKTRLVATVAIAASILFAVVAGIWSLKPAEKNPEQISSEFAETETFYRTQMNEQIAAIQCKLDKADEETRNQLEKDLQILTEDNNIFVEEIKEYTNEEMAIYYLVKHYSANLQSLQFINDKLGEYFNC
ncbi:MAG: hypothetical protein LBQ01_09105 [Prevotellaceae bacterium]|jgi:uncharacterized protein (DUF2164 family)|nr:hypothetical protein [Prevotellaceae bacterium]